MSKYLVETAYNTRDAASRRLRRLATPCMYFRFQYILLADDESLDSRRHVSYFRSQYFHGKDPGNAFVARGGHQPSASSERSAGIRVYGMACAFAYTNTQNTRETRARSRLSTLSIENSI